MFCWDGETNRQPVQLVMLKNRSENLIDHLSCDPGHGNPPMTALEKALRNTLRFAVEMFGLPMFGDLPLGVQVVMPPVMKRLLDNPIKANHVGQAG